MWQMSKKFIFISFLLLFSLAYLHAASPSDIALSIQGSGSQNFVDGFKNALTVEAKAAGYQVTEDSSAAKYNIKFTVEYDRIEKKSKFDVSLIKAADSSVIVTMEYFFADEEEMLLYGQLVFFLLMSNLPENVTVAKDDTWRNKWLYFNVSFDYSLMFLALQHKDLKEDMFIYNDNFDPPLISPVEDKIVPRLGAGFGLEFQFLNFMSIEPHAQVFWEEIVKDRKILNALFSVELKLPLKFINSLVIAPYGIAAMSMRFPIGDNKDDIFNNYPTFPDLIYGGGIQFAVKAGKSGAIFFDASFIYVKDDLEMKNYYDHLFPDPSKISYNHFLLGFSIGYKFGLFNRKH